MSSDEEPQHCNSEVGNLLVNGTWAEPDWIDGASLVEGRLALTEDQLAFMNSSAKRSVDETHPLFRATRHFAEALGLQASGYFPEASQTLLISALEVAGSGVSKVQNCAECGQSMYKISSKVYELAKKHLGEHAAKKIKNFYVHRSKFLHAGVLHGRHPYTRGFSPQLDPEDPTGCVVLRGAGADLNLVEFTSFILRAECKLWWTTPPSA
jgi:hypothetical protein